MSVTGLMGVFGFHRQVAGGQMAKGPYNVGVAGGAAAANTKQKITLGGATSGAFRLIFRGVISGQIQYNDLAATAKTTLDQTLSSVLGAADYTVTAASAGGPYTIEFTGAGQYAGQPVGFAIYDHTLNSGATISIVSDGADGRTGGSWYYLPATQVNFQPQQIVQSIPPEVGGNLFARGSYKGGVHGEGQVMLVPRGGLGLAELFHAFTGTMLKEGNVEADYNSGAINKLVGTGANNLQNGAFKYKFVPQSGTAAELPWYTIVRNVGGKFVEEFGDSRLGNFAFDMANTNILSIDASFISRKFGTIALNSGGASAAQQIGNQQAGNGMPFQAVDASVMLDANIAGVESAPAYDEALLPTRLNIGFANQLSNNEHVVGSYFLQDITNQARTANVTYSVYLKNPDLYSRAYLHGANMTTADAAWSPTIWKGKLDVTMLGGYISGSSGAKYSIRILIPEMDYMATPISLAGNNLVEYQLTTNVVLSQTAGVQPFTIEYVTNEDIL